MNSSILLNWMVQYADINFLPDVSYCVDVRYLSQNSVLHSECEITMTEFEFPKPNDSHCRIIVFNVHVANDTFMAAETLAYLGAEEGMYILTVGLLSFF